MVRAWGERNWDCVKQKRESKHTGRCGPYSAVRTAGGCGLGTLEDLENGLPHGTAGHWVLPCTPGRTQSQPKLPAGQHLCADRHAEVHDR